MTGPRILVLDDEPHLARIIQLKLNQVYSNVDVVHNLAEAITCILAQPYDAIISDIICDDGDLSGVPPTLLKVTAHISAGGAALLKLVRSQELREFLSDDSFLATPFIIITAGAVHALDGLLEDEEIRSVFYYTKPFGPKQLLANINEILSGKLSPELKSGLVEQVLPHRCIKCGFRIRKRKFLLCGYCCTKMEAGCLASWEDDTLPEDWQEHVLKLAHRVGERSLPLLCMERSAPPLVDVDENTRPPSHVADLYYRVCIEPLLHAQSITEQTAQRWRLHLSHSTEVPDTRVLAFLRGLVHASKKMAESTET